VKSNRKLISQPKFEHLSKNREEVHSVEKTCDEAGRKIKNFLETAEQER
jgi:hypothetical protein